VGEGVGQGILGYLLGIGSIAEKGIGQSEGLYIASAAPSSPACQRLISTPMSDICATRLLWIQGCALHYDLSVYTILYTIIGYFDHFNLKSLYFGRSV
jgi:hypothetical protein